ncbi:MAG TPA: sucrase ferredoxin [Acidimicrobiales bacterium]|nr:sucrase ferredoxin [Acidimicrobiales bacterium]
MDDALATRCSGFARAEDLDPAGTAGSHRGFVTAEIPLPWPREITEHPAVEPAAPALAAAGLRFQALVPDPSRGPAERRLLAFWRGDGPFARYRSRSWTVAGDDLAAALAAVAASPEDGPGPPDADGEGVGRHVLVCTHGRRDACCGTLGTRLATALPGLGAGVHVWRTSHTGGHRFAPTAVLLPEGTAWAYLDLDSLVGVADRTLDPAEAARRYRGCAGLDGPEVQAADGEALRTVGWSWLDHARTGTVVGRDGVRTRVRLAGESPAGVRASFEATVEVSRLVPVPDCGKPPGQAPKSAPELRMRDFVAA